MCKKLSNDALFLYFFFCQFGFVFFVFHTVLDYNMGLLKEKRGVCIEASETHTHLHTHTHTRTHAHIQTYG